MTALLSSAYFGPVQWYQKLHRFDRVVVEQHDTYRKQTYRNRCLIATSSGIQALTVPVERPAEGFHATRVKDIRISNHGNWRHLHWQALESAYGESPFFHFYADDLRPFFSGSWQYLFQFNMEICHTMCQLLDIEPNISFSDHYYAGDDPDVVDFRDTIDPKHPLPDSDFRPLRYYQVYERRIGFQPNLSILDLLFNMGPEAVFYL